MSAVIHIVAVYRPAIKKFRVDLKVRKHNYVRLFTVEEFLSAVRTRQFPWGIEITGNPGSAETERLWEYLGAVAASYEQYAAIFEKLPIRFTWQDFLKAYVEAHPDAKNLPGFTLEDFIRESGESEVAINFAIERQLQTLEEFGWVTRGGAGSWTKTEVTQ